jgi:alkylated DNA repair dioxygenase AlkB
MTPALERVQAAIEPVAHSMNCVLANLYRNGNDSMSWHADNERELGPSPTICSVSFGATRRFVLKHKNTGQKVTVDLEHGDVLVMGGMTQERWLHAIPKTSKKVDRRMNLTFRRHL